MDPNHRVPAVWLAFRAGRLIVGCWPDELPVPFGLTPDGTRFVGPARLRRRVLAALRHAGVGCRDRTAIDPLPLEYLVPRHPGLEPDEAAISALAALRHADHMGLVVGLSDGARLALVDSLIRTTRQRGLVVVVDSAAEDRWHGGIERADLVDLCNVRRIGAAARDVHWLGARHDLLVIDAPELMPWPALEQVLDGSTATLRVGMPGRADARSFARWGAGLGPLVGVVDEQRTPRCHELRVPLPPAAREAYEAAWDQFLLAFDRFATLHPVASFGTFVEQARKDPKQRPALHAWHEALRLAAWHEPKAEVTGELLARHRHQQVLVFTPDRRTAYALAEEHLIHPITAEIPRAERRQALAAFADGSLRTLVGPRLLDLGVPDCSADVAILVGGGFSRNQRSARCRRVASHGIVYELVSLDTVEVGRAHRWRGAAADATAVVHRR